MKVIVSACLMGDNTKYNGGNNINEQLKKLLENFEVIKVCPEVFGGLSIPRDPSERLEEKVVSDKGKDVTLNFIDGANKAMSYIDSDVVCAIVKERSPSCGYRQNYDGTFSHKLINRSGVFTEMLLKKGIKVYTEEELDRFINDFLKS